MCARFTLRTGAATIVDLFDLSEVPEMPPRYNIAPTQDVVAVVLDKHGEKRARLLRWGLVPSWAKDPTIGQRMINARREGINDKPAFRKAFERRRCLIPADGFFEWMEVEEPAQEGAPAVSTGHAQQGLFGDEFPEAPGPPRNRQSAKRRTRKQPFYIGLTDFRPFAFAGLWEYWKGEDQEPLVTCTIITTEPNDLVRPMHDRMPVILPREAHELWMDQSAPEDAVLGLLEPYPSAGMAAYPVDPIVNSPQNEGPECVRPVETDSTDLQER
ncbi:MAG TPA: SOS response-associated peptidase [Fimbriimonadaceae bacterium]|nr:SOS response-associated peptidase [Fimbriimonadaceae bacterium]